MINIKRWLLVLQHKPMCVYRQHVVLLAAYHTLICLYIATYCRYRGVARLLVMPGPSCTAKQKLLHADNSCPPPTSSP